MNVNDVLYLISEDDEVTCVALGSREDFAEDGWIPYLGAGGKNDWSKINKKGQLLLAIETHVLTVKSARLFSDCF